MSEAPEEIQPLNDRQQAFVNAYLGEARWNATRAALIAGYSGRTARFMGAENLTKPNIRAAISERLTESAMAADEVLARLGDQARGTLEDFIDEQGNLDLEQARKAGKLHLIKEYAIDQEQKGVEEPWETRKIRFKLHDAQGALTLLAKHHKLLAEREEALTPRRITEILEHFIDSIQTQFGEDQARAIALRFERQVAGMFANGHAAAADREP